MSKAEDRRGIGGKDNTPQRGSQAYQTGLDGSRRGRGRSPYREPSDNLTDLASDFNIRNPFALRRYMSLHSAGDFTLLADLSREMSTHTHPLVNYAGAWAAAEAAMGHIPISDQENPSGTFAVRRELLESAKGLWETAIVGFESEEDKTTNNRQRADLLGYELRAKNALAYFPSMVLAAKLFSGYDISEQEKEQALKETREGLISLARDVIDLREEDPSFFDTRMGMYRLALTGLLLPGRLIIPASIRENHYNSALLVDVSMERPHYRTSIQIGLGETSKRMFAVDVPDITIPGLRERTTLRRLLEREQRISRPELSIHLDTLSESLTTRLASFTN